jgi:hypothetical protein
MAGAVREDMQPVVAAPFCMTEDWRTAGAVRGDMQPLAAAPFCVTED